MSQWVAAAFVSVLCGCAASPPYTAESVIRAQQTTASQNRVASPRQSAAFAPPVQAPTNATPQDYRGTNLEHRITKLSDGGKVATLEDGSAWEINPSYWGETMVWQLAQKIVVNKGVNPGYPYQLDNEAAKDIAEARLTGGPGSR